MYNFDVLMLKIDVTFMVDFSGVLVPMVGTDTL